MPRRIVPALSVVFVLAPLFAATDARALAPGGDPRRVTVAVFGDSVVEGRTLLDPRRQGIAAQLERRLAARPELARGGDGLLAATNLFWRFSRRTVEAPRAPPRDGWQLQGVGTKIGGAGPSGYSAATSSPLATATTRVTGGQAVLLLESSREPSPFRVTAGGRSWALDTYDSTAPPHSLSVVLDLPAGARMLTVHGPSAGLLTFAGIIDRRPVLPGLAQVEVSDLGHQAHGAWTDLPNAPIFAAAEQQYSVSVFVWGYFAQTFSDPPGTPGDLGPIYARALRTRARIARLNGGRCLIASPTPVTSAPLSVRREFDAIDHRVARAEGCAYTGGLRHLWRTAAAGERAGLLSLDDLHPTARGAALIARILTPLLARLANA